MKKVLLAFDGTNFSEGAFAFARRMNQISPILATGIFLPQINYSNLWSYAEGMAGSYYIPVVEGDETVAIRKNIAKFESRCISNEMEYRVHKDFSEFAMATLRKETRFADLLILGGQSFYENIGINEPNESLKDALHNSECPVLIVPETFEFPDSNFLAYDGSDDSVFAIKQFAYLFPEFRDNPTLIVYAKDEPSHDFPDREYIEELAPRHFPDLEFFKLQLKPRDYFTNWIEHKQGAILVSGAFSRPVLSQIFVRSFVSEIIAEHKLPVFIAHR